MAFLLRPAFFLIIVLFINNAQARCILQDGSPGMLFLPADTFRIDADRAADTVNPVKTYITPALGRSIRYIDCENNISKYGKSVIGLMGQDSATRIYKTNIPGIGVKFLYTNGSSWGNFPSTSFVKCIDEGFDKPTELCALIIPPQSLYKVEFYKTQEKLALNNKEGEVVLEAGDRVYNWIENPSFTNHSLKLNMGEIKIVSTPVCNVSESINIDFNQVTGRTLTAAGVERNLDFFVNCRTDYGTYSATAAIVTDTPSADARYIRVKDAAGSQDTLGIKIRDSYGHDVLLNGTSTEVKSNNPDDTRATFNWKAILFPVNPGSRPTSGKFSAQAQIILNIN